MNRYTKGTTFRITANGKTALIIFESFGYDFFQHGIRKAKLWTTEITRIWTVNTFVRIFSNIYEQSVNEIATNLMSYFFLSLISKVCGEEKKRSENRGHQKDPASDEDSE